jgi:hypothetical protein
MYSELYGAVEMIGQGSYRMRTEQNVRDADAVLWFDRTSTPGGKATLNACAGMGRPLLVIVPGKDVRPSNVADWNRRTPELKVLNVAGNRESLNPVLVLSSTDADFGESPWW